MYDFSYYLFVYTGSKYVNEIVPAKNHTYDRRYCLGGMREIVDEHNLSKTAKQYPRRLKIIPWHTIWGGMVLGGYNQFLTWTDSKPPKYTTNQSQTVLNTVRPIIYAQPTKSDCIKYSVIQIDCIIRLYYTYYTLYLIHNKIRPQR